MNKEPKDWMCGSCQHHNFRKREHCQRCGASKLGGGGVVVPAVAMAGDWYCNVINCGAHNFANRTSCYQCGEFRLDNYGLHSPFHDDATGGLPGWKTGDWLCTRAGCGAHNYASRTECYKCATSRYFDG